MNRQRFMSGLRAKGLAVAAGLWSLIYISFAVDFGRCRPLARRLFSPFSELSQALTRRSRDLSQGRRSAHGRSRGRRRSILTFPTRLPVDYFPHLSRRSRSGPTATSSQSGLCSAQWSVVGPQGGRHFILASSFSRRM